MTKEINYDVRCLSCDSTNCQFLSADFNYKLFKCNECDLVFKKIHNLNTNLRQDLQNSIYTDRNLKNRINNPIFKKIAKERLNFLKNYISTGKILEIGCGTGEFLVEAKHAGFDIYGVDASPVFFKYLKTLNIPVEFGNFEDTNYVENSFDVIVAFHLLEHIHIPNTFINKIKLYLKNDGFLFFVTPNVDSKTNKLLGWNHHMYTELDHICLYSPVSIKNLFEKNNLKIIKIITNEFNYHIFSSLTIYLGRQKNYFFIGLTFFIRPFLYANIFSKYLNIRILKLNNRLQGHEIYIIGNKNEI